MEKIINDFFIWRLDKVHMKKFFSSNNGTEDQSKLLDNTIRSKVNADNPVEPDFCLQFVKHVMRALEAEGVQPQDFWYEELQALQIEAAAKTNKRYFKSYFVGESEAVSLIETKEIISNGTTGLTSWPAGIHLAKFLIENQPLISNKRILELGAGTGITGIFCLKSTEILDYIFTDCHEKVLTNLKLNADHNLAEHTNYRIETLDWQQALSYQDTLAQPDLILGADIVFDSRIIPDLVATILQFTKPPCVTLIASTIRNEQTYSHFLKELEDSGLSWCNCDYESEDPIRIIKITFVD
eukprot:TRINITY_DN4960_c0_g1_i1.p1 TRINITY_DN4960_c0_g1~~TRINITY_DN4960_c0_g1_i1.p1  ORF type:complete len:297 (-),score=23.72 TRINITY_DN4960_c0_g1_i1:50-940(-)